MDNNNFIDDFFSKKSSLGELVEDYHIRHEQIEMAHSIYNAISDKDSLVIEAGTGVGKTFAYLLPALLAGGKVIISTATKNLQDQLFFYDIPKIRDALKIPVEIKILKGRANYICKLRTEDALIEGQFLNKKDASHINKIKRFSDHSVAGEISELEGIPENSIIWPLVTSNRENCLGHNCDFYKECFLIKARKEALESEVVIVNHHLFFADFVLKDAELSEILPNANTVIFDEAHQVPDVASIFFGESISTNQILVLINDINNILSKIIQDQKPLITLFKNIKDNIFLIVDLFDQNMKISVKKITNHDLFINELNNLIILINRLYEFLSNYNDQGSEFEKLTERTKDLREGIISWKNHSHEDSVYWLETYSKSIQLNMTPVSISSHFKKFQEASDSAWIFTSATLAVNKSFEHFQTLMGLNKAKTKLLMSPFDYSKNAYLYVPHDMPEASSPLFNLTLVKKVIPLICASKGRAFILSTSIKAMHEIKSLLADEFEKLNIKYPIFLQGEESKRKLLDDFKSHGNAILVGSLSFWEGVDVRGGILSLVIIDKLPFQSPGDPVFESKINMVSNEGKNPFMTLQLPQAIITLKQGAGRLIRDEFDRGVLMVCDSRLVDKPYGKIIWKSLPTFKRSRNEGQIIDFLNNLD